jgi:mono/diheme cytochrome c family protein
MAGLRAGLRAGLKAGLWQQGPAFLAGVLLFLLLAGCAPGEDGEARQAETTGRDFWRLNRQEEGSEIYRRNCATCHGLHGYGYEGIFPPLRDNPNVAGPHVNTIMPVVFGRGAMPGFAGLLDDDELALVVSYIRRQWGNRQRPVSPADISGFRTEGVEVPLDPFAGD